MHIPKKILIAAALVTLLSSQALAFTVETTLDGQVDSYTQTELDSAGALTLQKSEQGLSLAVFSPDYKNDNTVYATTSGGVYRNNSFDANFYQDQTWPADIQNMPLKASFGGQYANNGAIALYSGDTVYVSYNKGSSWGKKELATSETVSQVALAPTFPNQELLYYITPTGLYSQNPSLSNSSLVLASDADGAVTHFAYAPSTTSDSYFYVVKGTKVMKTENLAQSWLTYDVGAPIRQLMVVDDGTDSGDVLVLSGAKKLERSYDGYTYGAMNVPAGIQNIYEITPLINGSEDYVMSTDQGIYITYTGGDQWAKIPYSITDYSQVSNLAAIDVNGQAHIFFIMDNILYRDLGGAGTMVSYMNGISAVTTYAASGSAVSVDLVPLSGEVFNPAYMIDQATIWADGDAAGQTLTFYLTVDGENWEEVTPNEPHTFLNQGNILKWKIEMATADTTVTPVVNSIMMDFGFDVVPDGTCAGFSDVPTTDPLCPALTYVKNEGIFEGYPDGTFLPDEAINRAETVKVISEGFNLPLLADPADNLGFSDVILHEWYMTYLATSKAAGVIQGYPDGTFKPSRIVNYVELIKIFFETADVTLPTVPAGSEWYQKYLTYAKNNGYLVYDQLDAGMKRGDVATLFYQMSQK